MTYMTTSQVAEYLEVHVETIRYYERIQLISDVHKDKNGYKQYDHEHIRRLLFVLVCKDMGFTLNEIKAFFNNSTYTDIMMSYKEQEEFPSDLEKNLRQIVQDKIVSLTHQVELMQDKINHLNGFIKKLDKVAISSEKECRFNQ